MYCITERSALFSLVISLGTIGVGEEGQEDNRQLPQTPILWRSGFASRPPIASGGWGLRPQTFSQRNPGYVTI